MSSEERLRRLGLSHLAHDPVALKAELDRRIAADDAERERWRRAAQAEEVGDLWLVPDPGVDPIRIPRGSVVVVGRAPGCDVVLASPLVGRQQARFDFRASPCLVEDAGSPGGTWLDERRVGAPAPIGPGARLRLGGLLVEVKEAPDVREERRAEAPERRRAEELDALWRWHEDRLPARAASLATVVGLALDVQREIQRARERGGAVDPAAASRLRQLATALDVTARMIGDDVAPALEELCAHFDTLAIEAAQALEEGC